jgi:hypothetical protein
MTEEAGGKPEAKDAGDTMDAAVVQIREVVKWLIGGFAAIGVALAAGSQLSEMGALTGWRLVAAFAAVLVVLIGIAVAILYATKVMTPRAISLDRLVHEEGESEIGQQIKADPSLLLGHGKSLSQFAKRREAALAAENSAWAAYEAAAAEEKKSLKGGVRRAEAERKRIDDAMDWLFSYARFVEVSHLFKVALRAMFLSAAIAALGIAGFAWAAHPDEEAAKEEPATIVAKAPLQGEIDLSAAGRETLGDDLGPSCDTEAVPAVALAGSAEALEVIAVASETCALNRFLLTPELGSFAATEAVQAEAEPGDGKGEADEEPIQRDGNPRPPTSGG